MVDLMYVALAIAIIILFSLLLLHRNKTWENRNEKKKARKEKKAAEEAERKRKNTPKVYQDFDGKSISMNDPKVERAIQDRDMRKAKNWPTSMDALKKFIKVLRDNCVDRCIEPGRCCIPELGWVEDVHCIYKGAGHGNLVFSEEDGSVVRIQFDNGSTLELPEIKNRPAEELDREFRALLDDPKISNEILIPAYQECLKKKENWALIERDKFTGKPLTRYEMEILANILEELDEFTTVVVDAHAQGLVLVANKPGESD